MGVLRHVEMGDLMPTLYGHRLLIVVPAARLAAVVGWFDANLPGTAPTSSWAPLSATGAAPATHYWNSGGWQDSEAKAILLRLCQLASVTPPTGAQWAGWTFAQKRSWLRGVRDTVYANYGAWLGLSANDGDWDDPVQELTSMGAGLRPVQEATP